MRIIELKDENFSEALLQTASILRSGGVAVVPTDTVYGIVGDAAKAATVKKIFKIKNRPQKKALPVFVKDVATARKIAYISDAKAEFLRKIWPGPVTVVFQRKAKLSEISAGGTETIGIRMPEHKFLLELLARLDFPLAQTSANVSGGAPAEDLEEIKKYLYKNFI